MPDEKHEPNRNSHFRQKLLSAAAILLLVLLAARFSIQYMSFVSQTIYQESTSHLEEVLHKSNNMLKEMVRKNVSYLHLYNCFLESTSDADAIQAYIEKAQQDIGFVGFYFLSYDGNYMTVNGETGYLGLQTNLDEKLADGEDVVMNTALPGKAQMLVFICPETQGSYRGFAYDAVAISYYNDAVLKLLDNSAFQGNASNYVIYPDGRVVIDNSVNREKTIYNFIAMLRDYSDLSEEEILTLSDDFAQGRSGNRKVTLGDTRYYLIYEGTAVQSWTMLGLVPVNIVNASLDKLWFHTVQIVTGIAAGLAAAIILLILHRNSTTLHQKNTEILYRDELFQKLSLNVDDVFLMLDAETSKVDYVSPNIERLLGIPWKEVRQDVHVLAELYPKGSPAHGKNFLEGLRSGEQREWDFEYEHLETKERRWFHNIAMGSEVEGRTKYILVLSDRTADKQANQALSEAVAAAETANRAKSTFLSNMSHDIRTPMNAIIGFTTLAVSNIDDKERVKDYLTKTLASSNHLLSLINDVLDMSRIESGKIHLEETEVNLSDVLHDLKTIVSGQIHAKQLDLYMDAMDVTDEDVYCDKTRLNQVLLNLLSNAIKFTPAGGMVSVRVRQLAGPMHGCGQYEFRVKDNGIGMSPEFAQKIFEPFERERTSTVSKIQGTGLGMAITKNIVDMMGGTIEVQTEQGKGTEFIIRVPLRAQAEHGAVGIQGADARRVERLRVGRLMDILQGIVLLRELIGARNVRRDHVLQLPDAGVQRGRHGLADVILRHAGRQRVNGVKAVGHAAAARRLLADGVRHRLAKAVGLHLAVEDVRFARVQTVLAVGLVEVGHVQRAGVVHDAHLDQREPAADILCARLGRDHGADAHGLAGLRGRDRAKLRPVLVPPGVQARQVAQRRHAELLKCLRFLRPDAGQRLERGIRCVGHVHPSCAPHFQRQSRA